MDALVSDRMESDERDTHRRASCLTEMSCWVASMRLHQCAKGFEGLKLDSCKAEGACLKMFDQRAFVPHHRPHETPTTNKHTNQQVNTSKTYTLLRITTAFGTPTSTVVSCQVAIRIDVALTLPQINSSTDKISNTDAGTMGCHGHSFHQLRIKGDRSFMQVIPRIGLMVCGQLMVSVSSTATSHSHRPPAPMRAMPSMIRPPP